MAWNTLRDLLRGQGNESLLGSRDTLREAFRLELIQDRNLPSHTYNRATADAIAANIQKHYLSCFQGLRTRLQIRLEQEEC